MNSQVWKSISDIMSILMVVFLFISISYMYQSNYNAINKDDIKKSIYLSLVSRFSTELDELNIIIKSDSTIVLNDLHLVFEKDSYNIRPEFERHLSIFFLEYVDILENKYIDNIKHVEITGHTSSEWNSAISPVQSYINNLKLSQERAYSVLKFFLNLSNFEKKPWLVEKFTSKGAASTSPILNIKGVEDKESSRRVEVKIIIKNLVNK